MTAPVLRLRGSLPPLITPLRDDAIDFDTLGGLVSMQIAAGSHGIVVGGTTGEPSMLTAAERADPVAFVVAEVAGRVPVVAATGSQSLAETLWLTEQATETGADALLVVTPYYSRPPQRGLIEYMRAVSESSPLPMLLYHIPGRAAVSVSADTVVAMRDACPTLVGVKHAAADIDFVSELLARCGVDFTVLVGLEHLSLPMLAVGAAGMVNALANVAPRAIIALYDAVASDDLTTARELGSALLELNQAIFWDTNPIPLKYMMSRIGLLPSAEHRLPMVPADEQLKHRLDRALDRAVARGVDLAEPAVARS